MENRDDLFDKMPFYMTYPMQNMYLTELEYEKDMERMKELYPREVLQLQQMVEQRCDEMECEGSRMYDENPDRQMLEEEARRLCERFLRENPQYNILMPPPPMPRPPMPRPEGPMAPPPGRPPMPRPDGSMMPPPGRPPMPRPETPIMPRTEQRWDNMQMQEYDTENELSSQQYYRRENPWLRSLIGILFHDEIYRRRCRYRRCRRWW